MRIPAFPTILVLLAAVSYSCNANKDNVSRLKHDLLVGYDPLVLPTLGKNATRLVITMHPQNIQLDETTSTFTMFGVLVMGWTDERIKWDPAQYGDERYAFFADDELWKPELTVYNYAAKRDVHEFGKQRMVATNTGHIYWSPVVRFDTQCSHNVKKWPFDNAACTVRIGSWNHNGDDVFMEVWNAEDPHLNLTDLIPNPQWTIRLKQFGIRNEVFKCCPEFQEFYIDWELERKYVHLFAAVHVPAIALAWLILTTFWMNPRSVERSALLLTALVVNSWFLQYANRMIPPNGDDVPRIIDYYRYSLILVCAALVWTIFSRYIAQTRRTSKIPIPAQVLGFLESWPSKLLFIAPRAEDDLARYKMTEDDTGLTGLHSLVNHDWAWLAHLLDRVMFAVCVVLYVAFLIAYV